MRASEGGSLPEGKWLAELVLALALPPVLRTMLWLLLLMKLLLAWL